MPQSLTFDSASRRFRGIGAARRWRYESLGNCVRTSTWAGESTLDPAEYLSAEEIAKLSQVQAQFQGHTDCVELELNERRLGFVRWLVDRGLLGEDL
jgi:hypothetical protein